MNEIRVEAISASYGARQALIDVSFDVASRQIYGLLGPNGGGKTTLFRVLCTLLRPASGDAYVGGVSVVDDPMGARQQIGVVFQTNSLDRELTVSENLDCQAALHGLRKTAARLRSDELLDRFGLAERRNDLAGTLSGGLQRRLEIAKSLLHGPRVRLRGHQFVAQVIEAFPGRIGAITVSRPTLEDVFVHETGHRFADEVATP